MYLVSGHVMTLSSHTGRHLFGETLTFYMSQSLICERVRVQAQRAQVWPWVQACVCALWRSRLADQRLQAAEAGGDARSGHAPGVWHVQEMHGLDHFAVGCGFVSSAEACERFWAAHVPRVHALSARAP